MSLIVSSGITDWSTLELDDASFDQEATDLGNRFEFIFDEIIAGSFTAPTGTPTSATFQMNVGGTLTAIGTDLINFISPTISQFTYAINTETLSLKGSFNGIGTETVAEASHSIDGQTISFKGSLSVNADTGDYTGTIASVSVLTADNYALTFTGAGLNATRIGTETTFGGVINKLVITGPGSSTPLLTVTNFTINGGLPLIASNNIADFINTFVSLDDSVSGGAGNDVLYGFGGNDTLNGGLGNDTYFGGPGSDTYYIAQAGDSIGAGDDALDNDTVRVALAGNPYLDLRPFDGVLENVVFTGIGPAAIHGNSGSNSLTGGAGNDTLSGHESSDLLSGGAGDDVLDGGTSPDTMNGGAGNDTYVVDDAADSVVDSGGTFDTVDFTGAGDVSLASFAGIENLIMLNAAGVGTGTAANNGLASLNGTHTLHGGLGNDTYNVQAGDEASEDSSGGGAKDWAFVTLADTESFTLGDGIENLTLLHVAEGTISATGNALNNSIAGANNADDSIDGGLGNDTINGGGGNDTLDGAAGKDSLVGGAGDDIFHGLLINPTATTLALEDSFSEALNGGTDSVVLDDGGLNANPTAFALTLWANIENLEFSSVDPDANINVTGNALNNTILASDGKNKLDGAAGNDSIDGGGGNDTLLGGVGDDTLAGADDSDSLDGGMGNDSYNGGAGDDVYVIAQDGDSIDTAADGGLDTARVALATSTYLNLVGKDFLENVVYTGTGGVTIIGNTSANSLVGAAGADSIFGSAGNDSLDGGTGADTLNGGADNDVLVVDSLLDSVSGGTGTDTVVSKINYVLAFASDIEDVTLGGTAAKATGNANANVLTGNASANTLDGGAGADTMIGGAGADTYFVDNAGDMITETIAGAAGGIDQVYTLVDFSLAGSQIENATITDNSGHVLIGNELANKLAGLGAADTLAGGLANDTLTGNGGNDRLDGGAGADSMTGGAGDDTYVVDSLLDKISELANQGTDTVETSITFSVAAIANVENITLTGGDAINATGNALANVLIGNAGNNSISGGAGNDTIDGGGGADTIDGGLGIDAVTSATFDVDISGYTGVEDILLAGSGNLNAVGNGLANSFTGNAGDNRLTGGGGNDVLYGAGGSDTAVYGENLADYNVVWVGGESYDISQIDGSFADGIDHLIQIEFLSFADVPSISINTLLGNTPIGGAGDDLYTGNALANSIDGGAGNDTLIGNAGTDTLTGGIGNDSLSGGADSDRLDGGAGADTLAGGSERDIYEFDSADTVVEDANGGNDAMVSGTIDITGLPANVEEAQLSGSANLNATGGGGNDLLFGNAGNNMLTGLGGNDSLLGGGGSDTGVYSGNFDEYVVTNLGNGAFRVTHSGGDQSDGIDELNSIEFLKFADVSSISMVDAVAGSLPPPAPTPTLKVELDSGNHLLGSGTIEITYSFMGSVPSYEIDNAAFHDGFATPTTDLQTAITAALQLWSDVTNIHFTLVADSVDGGAGGQFRFGTEAIPDNDTLFGYAYLPQDGFANGELWTGDVWINRNGFLYDDSDNADFVAGTSVFTTLVHEIGHTLGLQHPFDDGSHDAPFLPAETDNNLYSIMAYNPAPANGLLDLVDTDDVWYQYGGGVEVLTPMLYDISTVQALYGVNDGTRSGNDVYGAGATDPRYAFSLSKPFFMTIWDGGGNDTIDASGYSLPSIIDLQPGHFSSIGMSQFLGLLNTGDVVDHGVYDDTMRLDEGYDYLEADPESDFGLLPQSFQNEVAAAGALPADPLVYPPPDYDLYNGTNNLTIAETAVIENAVGGGGADVLIGNVWSNQLSGGAGNDTLAGGLGLDTLTGGLGVDRFVLDAAANGANVDTIADFVHGTDKIVLDQTIFTALGVGALPAGDFTTGAISGSINLRYNATAGDLFYDQDGSGGAVEVKIATFGMTTHPSITASDFLVVA